MDGNVNSINWFEIPAADINRAKKFYETVLNISVLSAPVAITRPFVRTELLSVMPAP